MNLWVSKGKEQVALVSEPSTPPQRTMHQHHVCKAYACSVCNRFDPLEEAEGADR